MDGKMQTLSETHGESGQALVIALLALALAVLLVTGFLYYASTSQRATTATRQQTVDRYSADAGIEYGIWQLENGASVPFTDTIVINGQAVVITITEVFTP
jgi:type II secretory pathway component PulK